MKFEEETKSNRPKIANRIKTVYSNVFTACTRKLPRKTNNERKEKTKTTNFVKKIKSLLEKKPEKTEILKPSNCYGEETSNSTEKKQTKILRNETLSRRIGVFFTSKGN